MRPLSSIVLFALIGVLLAGCRQADAPLPTPNATVQEELFDVTRDLEYIATGYDAQGPTYLADDLRKYALRPAAIPAVDELSRRTATVLAGSKLTQPVAQRLAHNLWLSMAARENSERQTETLQNDTQALLLSVGIAEEQAQQVATQVGEVQRAVNDRPRRWYELF